MDEYGLIREKVSLIFLLLDHLIAPLSSLFPSAFEYLTNSREYRTNSWVLYNYFVRTDPTKKNPQIHHTQRISRLSLVDMREDQDPI